MFKWVKKVMDIGNTNNNNGLNDEGLQSDLNDLYSIYDKALNDQHFGEVGDDYGDLESYEIKWIISDTKWIISNTIKLTRNHPELLLHLNTLNELVFQLKMATTTLLDIYDNENSLTKDVYAQQSNDAKEIIYELSQRISDSNKKLSGLYQDENSATINFLKKQMGMAVDQDEDLYEQVKKATNDPEHERKLDARIEEAYTNKMCSDAIDYEKYLFRAEDFTVYPELMNDTNRKIKQAKKIISENSQGNTAKFVNTKEEKDE